MTTKININDHDALNAAFAEKVAGWRKVGHMFFPPDLPEHANVFRSFPIPPFTKSMDAVLPWLEKHSRDTGEARGGEPEVFRFYSPIDQFDTWTVEVWWLHHDGDVMEAEAEAPTLPHAAVVALLRARGVTVEEDKP